MKISFTSVVVLFSLLSFGANSKQYTDDVHKDDYKWIQLDLIHTIDQKPHVQGEGYQDTYFEMEFGGRSGIFDLYGYVDLFDVTNSSDSDKHDGQNLFVKFAPRMSLDALTGKDLSFGPVQELYIANVTSAGPNQLEILLGLGSDVEIPFLGKMGMNLYSRYSVENFGNKDENSFNGYMFSMNWFKPFYFFENGSFISYQGYLDYMFGADKYEDQPSLSTSGGGTFHGIYWHSKQYAVGYGLKYFHDTYGIKDGAMGFAGKNESTGFGHYFTMAYKF
ncbi:outer membrane protein OmpK [Vibrio sp. 99-8-1]|uniref:nucleoside-specific channel-forming Tsx family protein n=1 Tax=Vibrio sp. 99-8-1 TaxID=2607602 RepID=UPI00149347BA|nr:outer membrane protein OmpK [Vibrio sp. 99-8-1]NOI67856.1 hypothetical protein [Vibrio sp. 99-8-1]